MVEFKLGLTTLVLNPSIIYYHSGL